MLRFAFVAFAFTWLSKIHNCLSGHIFPTYYWMRFAFVAPVFTWLSKIDHCLSGHIFCCILLSCASLLLFSRSPGLVKWITVAPGICFAAYYCVALCFCCLAFTWLSKMDHCSSGHMFCCIWLSCALLLLLSRFTVAPDICFATYYWAALCFCCSRVHLGNILRNVSALAFRIISATQTQ